MALTAEVMDQEAAIVAEGIADIIAAGVRTGGSTRGKIGVLLGEGLILFGDIENGIDDEANEARFIGLVLSNLGKSFVEKYLPLTKLPTESA